MDERSGLCLGCLRTIDEIIAWGRQSDEEKKKVWSLIEERKKLRKIATSQLKTP